jgi:hypothetical protein
MCDSPSAPAIHLCFESTSTVPGAHLPDAGHRAQHCADESRVTIRTARTAARVFIQARAPALTNCPCTKAGAGA